MDGQPREGDGPTRPAVLGRQGPPSVRGLPFFADPGIITAIILAIVVSVATVDGENFASKDARGAPPP